MPPVIRCFFLIKYFKVRQFSVSPENVGFWHLSPYTTGPLILKIDFAAIFCIA